MTHTGTDPVPTVEEVYETWHRLSPRMLMIHPVAELGRALPALIGVFFASNHNGNGSWWSLAVAVVVLVFAVSRWFTTRLRITPEQVQLRHGLIRRRTTATPIDRIRTVDVTSHLLHRALGLARVSIGTGTSDRRGRGRLVLDGLDADAAEHLRSDLLHGRGAVSTAVVTDPGPSTPDEVIARLDPAWIKLAPFTLSGAFTALLVFGFAERIWQETRVNLLHVGPLGWLDRQLGHASVLAAVLVVIALILTFVALASYAGYLLTFWDFRLTRHVGGTLHVDRGLLTSRATSIERRRLVGIEISQPVLLRAVGGARTVAIATGLRARRGAERGGEVLLPPAPAAVATAVAAVVLGTAGPFGASLVSHGQRALRRRLTRGLGGALNATGVAELLHLVGAHGWVVPLVALSIPISVPVALDRYRSLGHALVDGYVVTRFGSVVRRHSAIACDGVIGWNTRSSLFQRRLGLTTLTATTAAGKQGYRITDIDTVEALRFVDAASPGLITEFRA